MDRRTFVGASVIGAAVAGLGASPVLAGGVGPRGEQVTLSGWLAPAAAGPGHYLVFGPEPGVTDPATPRHDAWPGELAMVFPADGSDLRPGKVTLQGRRYRGRLGDSVTGYAAATVITGARAV